MKNGERVRLDNERTGVMRSGVLEVRNERVEDEMADADRPLGLVREADGGLDLNKSRTSGLSTIMDEASWAGDPASRAAHSAEREAVERFERELFSASQNELSHRLRGAGMRCVGAHVSDDGDAYVWQFRDHPQKTARVYEVRVSVDALNAMTEGRADGQVRAIIDRLQVAALTERERFEARVNGLVQEIGRA